MYFYVFARVQALVRVNSNTIQGEDSDHELSLSACALVDVCLELFRVMALALEFEINLQKLR